jgi:hypothetical protein
MFMAEDDQGGHPRPRQGCTLPQSDTILLVLRMMLTGVFVPTLIPSVSNGTTEFKLYTDFSSSITERGNYAAGRCGTNQLGPDRA